MPLTPTDVVWGFLVPAIVSAAVLFVLRRVLPQALADRYPGAIALAIGFFSGYGLLALAPWQPSSHWHWLPYVLLAASLVTPVALAEGVWSFERGLLYGLVALLASWLLVPTWDDLEPPRGVSIVGLAVYITLLAILLEKLARRLPGPVLAAILGFCMIFAAVVLALSGNLRMGQIAGAAAAAFIGCAMASRRRPEHDSLQGLALPFALHSAGLLYVGRVNSFSGLPDLSYLLPTLAPLGLWASFAGLGGNPMGTNRKLLGAILVVLPLVVAVGLALAAESG